MNPCKPIRPAVNQQGLSLIVVLIALLVISFAAIALLRSSDTSTLVAGNLSFQRAALASGDAATEEAIAWLEANAAGATLYDNDAANGYFATTADVCDLTGTRTPDDDADDVDWTNDDPGDACNMEARAVTPDGVADGFTVSYVINRVCNAAGDPNAVLAPDGTTMACSRAGGGASEGSTKGGAAYGNTPLTGGAQTYYRITTRIGGPRGTVRFVQSLVVL